jgi:K+-sensing histidine kinase KdpD
VYVVPRSLFTVRSCSARTLIDGDCVFDMFWRADAARTADTNVRQYGLGLPLCRKLVTLLGCSVSVSTSSGGAFAIKMAFPLNRSTAEREDPSPR